MTHRDWTVNVEDPLGPLVATSERQPKLDAKNQFNEIAREVNLQVREVDIPNYVGDMKKFRLENPDKTLPIATVKLQWMGRNEPQINMDTGYDQWTKKGKNADPENLAVILREAELNGLNPELAKENQKLRDLDRQAGNSVFQDKVDFAHKKLVPPFQGDREYFQQQISDIEQARAGKFSWNIDKEKSPQATTTYQSRTGLKFPEHQKKPLLNFHRTGSGKDKEDGLSMDR